MRNPWRRLISPTIGMSAPSAASAAAAWTRASASKSSVDVLSSTIVTSSEWSPSRRVVQLFDGGESGVGEVAVGTECGGDGRSHSNEREGERRDGEGVTGGVVPAADGEDESR